MKTFSEQRDVHTDTSAPLACWTWGGRLDKEGYGRTGRRELAHRVAYADEHGSVPEGLDVDHLCRTRSCVNPRHLEAVTHAENMRRSQPYRKPPPLAARCINGHEYAPENVYLHRGRRHCRECNRQRVAEYAARRRQSMDTRLTPAGRHEGTQGAGDGV